MDLEEAKEWYKEHLEEEAKMVQKIRNSDLSREEIQMLVQHNLQFVNKLAEKYPEYGETIGATQQR